MKILAIDTSMEACSVAVAIDANIHEKYTLQPQQHTHLILSMIDEVLLENKIQLKELDAIAFSAGPGSFTGLRIGAGIVQGLAFAQDLKVIPVCTLASLANQGRRLKNLKNIIACIDARMNEVYCGLFQSDIENKIHRLKEPSCSHLSEVLVPAGEDWVGVGNGFEENFTQEMHLKAEPSILYSRAFDVAELAIDLWKQKKMTDAEGAIPNYLREGNYRKA